MINYEPLWKIMERKEISQYMLMYRCGINAEQVGRLQKNMYVSMHTLETFCKILDYRVEDVIEIRNE